MCKNITHGHYYQWIDVDSATHVKCSFESSASQMFFFATQHFEFVSWGQITSRFCCKYSSTVLYFIDYCFALTGTKKLSFFYWLPQREPSQDRRNPWFSNPCSGTAGSVIVPRRIPSRARRFAFSCSLIVPVVFVQVPRVFFSPYVQILTVH